MPTCLKSPPHPHTVGVCHCRHNVVVGDICSETLRESDDDYSTQGGGDVPVVQVGVGWACTIVNSAVIPWLKK